MRWLKRCWLGGASQSLVHCVPPNSALLTDAYYSALRTPCSAAKRER